MNTEQTDVMIRLLDQLADGVFKVANELARANDIADGKRDLTDYDEIPMTDSDKLDSVLRWFGEDARNYCRGKQLAEHVNEDFADSLGG